MTESVGLGGTTIAKLAVRTRRALHSPFFKIVPRIRRFHPEECLVLFSDPRGGSTWLTEMIHQLPRTAVVWEPLYLYDSNPVNELGFSWRQYIPENEQWPEAKAIFCDILGGRVLNNWTSFFSPPVTFLWAKRILVKFCRANAMIPWLTKTFAFNLTPIHLVRHPFAVVASQLRHGGWNYPFQGFTIPDCRYNGIYLKHKEFLRSLQTKEEALVAMWCLTNSIPLRYANKNENWITIFYERLLSQPEGELQRIFERLGLPLPTKAFHRLATPSATAKNGIFTASVETQTANWESYFSDSQLLTMNAVLQNFGVTYHTDIDNASLVTIEPE